jgi:hypothetical protein
MTADEIQKKAKELFTQLQQFDQTEDDTRREISILENRLAELGESMQAERKAKERRRSALRELQEQCSHGDHENALLFETRYPDHRHTSSEKVERLCSICGKVAKNSIKWNDGGTFFVPWPKGFVRVDVTRVDHEIFRSLQKSMGTSSTPKRAATLRRVK